MVIGKQQSTGTPMVHPFEDREYTGEEGGTRGPGVGPCMPEQEPRGENARPMRSVRTDILKAKPRKGDGRGTNVPPLHPPRCGIAHQSDLPVSSKYLSTCIPNQHLLSRSHPLSSPINDKPHPDMTRQQKNIWVAAGDGDLDRVKAGLVIPSPTLSDLAI